MTVFRAQRACTEGLCDLRITLKIKKFYIGIRISCDSGKTGRSIIASSFRRGCSPGFSSIALPASPQISIHYAALISVLVWAPGSILPCGLGERECEVTQLCPTLCNPMDCSLPGTSVHGTFQARVLEWGAISFSSGSCRPRDRT